MLSYRKLAMRVLGRPLHTGGGIDSPRPASQRAAAFILTAAMLTTLAAPAFADTWCIENGNITVKAGDTKGTNKVSQGSIIDKVDTNTVITNNNKNTASSNTVTIEAKDKDDKVEVKLDNVNIDTSKQNKAAVSVTGSGDTTIELDGDNKLKSGSAHAGLEHNKTDTSGELTIQDNNKDGGSLKATGGQFGAGIGGAGVNDAQVKITGGKITATGGEFGAGIGGGYGAKNNSNSTGNQITIRSNENGSPTVNAVGGGTKKGIADIGGAGIGTGSKSDANTAITLEGKVTIKATAGKGNVAIGTNGNEQVFTGLAGGTSITRKDSDKNDIPPLPGDNVPTPSGGDTAGGDSAGGGSTGGGSTGGGSTGGGSTGGGSTGGDSTGGDSTGGDSADVSVQESVFPGLVVTGKDGQRTSYTSIRGNNILSLRVGRFTASFRISLSTLRQLRAEGIDTITFQTILCSTTLSVDELLALGGEDTPVALAHSMGTARLTVGGADHSELLK